MGVLDSFLDLISLSENNEQLRKKLLLSLLLAIFVYLPNAEWSKSLVVIVVNPYTSIGGILIVIACVLYVNWELNRRISSVTEEPFERILEIIDKIYFERKPMLRILAGENVSNLPPALAFIVGGFALLALFTSLFSLLILELDKSLNLGELYNISLLGAAVILLISFLSIIVSQKTFSPKTIIASSKTETLLKEVLHRGVTTGIAESFLTRAALEVVYALLWIPIDLHFTPPTFRTGVFYVQIKGQESYNKHVKEFFQQLFKDLEQSLVVEETRGYFHIAKDIVCWDKYAICKPLGNLHDLATKPPVQILNYLFKPTEELPEGVIHITIRDSRTHKPLVRMYFSKFIAVYTKAVYNECPPCDKDRERKVKRLIREGKLYYGEPDYEVLDALAVHVFIFGDTGFVEYIYDKLNRNLLSVPNAAYQISQVVDQK